MIILNEKDLNSVVSIKDVIDAVEEGFKQYALGTVTMPFRGSIKLPKYKGSMGWMPAYIEGLDALGLKILGGWRDNPSKHNLPFLYGHVQLIDPSTGILLAILNGAWVTEMRTGAVSGVATKYLAREDAKVVGMFGAGVQARTQLMGVAAVRNITEARVFDIESSATDKYCAEMGERLNIDVVAVREPMDAVKGCDIILTATTSHSPVFDGEWLEEGTHINAIGACRGGGIKELDATTVKLSKVVIDQREACLEEAGGIIDAIADGVITEDHIYAELGELVMGQKKGRTNKHEITLFKSVGLGLQDMATAKMIYETAKSKNIGLNIPF